MSEINWTSIRADYEGGSSLRQLAAKYGVSKSVIGDRKYAEQWTETQRTVARTPIRTQEVVRPDMNAAVRAALGFKLRFEQNKTWEEVAVGAGYASRGAAHDAVIRESRRHISSDIQDIRDRECYRLEQLQMRCYTAGMDEGNEDWTWAIDRFAALSKRKSELMNLDIKPDDQALQQNYTKRIMLVTETLTTEVSS